MNREEGGLPQESAGGDAAPVIAVLVALIFGFVAGNIVFLMLFRWFAGPLHVLWETPSSEFARYSVMLAVVILHPAPWLLAVIPYVTYRIVTESSEVYRLWFLGSFYVSFLYLLVLGLVFWRRVRRSAQQRAPDNALERERGP
jgi:hypothetical protein